jgi:adenylate cyclase
MSFRLHSDSRQFVAAVKHASPTPNRSLSLAMATPIDELTADVARINLQALAISLLIALISLPIVFLAARRMSRPLDRLSGEAQKIAAFDLAGNIPVESHITEIRHLEETMQSAKTGLRTFGLYVPVELVRQILRSGVSPKLGGERRALTVLFSDIAGFTSIAETASPEDLMSGLSDYFQVASQVIHGSGGSINKFIGDGILAVWNAPLLVDDHVSRACRCALQFQARLKDFNTQQQGKGRPALHTRIGIHTGMAIIGNVGASDKLEYTALGDVVNIAARLEQLNKEYGTEILVSAEVETNVADQFLLARVGEASLKGRSQKTTVFELLAERSPEVMPPEKEA